MNDLTTDSDRVIEEARRVRDDNREGGRHRRSGSIGKGSAKLKTQHVVGKIKRIVLAVAGIIVAAMVAGLVIDGIGFTGIMVTFLAIVAATVALSAYPKIKVPKRADLTKGDVRQMVGKTELWLEHQRPALPPPAAKIVEDMGVQLDSLGLQLETIDQNHPAAREIRSLVGDVLPQTVDSYRNIPAHLRSEKRAGSTPDEQLTDSLGKISKEIDSVTRQLAEGSLDDLAIKTRYLEYKYGENHDTSGEKA
ncbi:hypothetical protein GCM10023115_56230 [Pontixanthobacter gangjinensis]|uniref:5-bromo-4-chloroindolyl phosphate hydrolysis protein n=1 Tax=Pontixanthobacter gangjinensis TaxID=1028742 RepID=A0A6I4SSG1_9SPHN|nr:hypothetical protein [Pontixanthobacter gangjinensis]MXO57906.1 hypothetical protein [Pontixanthobacter gangjinensis]